MKIGTKEITHREVEAFVLGIKEAHSGCGMTYDDDPLSPCSVAYDEGRNVGENVVCEEWTAFIIEAALSAIKADKPS